MCVELQGLYLPVYMFCCMRASVSGLIALLVLDDGGRRGHEKKLFKRRFRLDTRKFVFSNRVVDNWNSLSPQCVNSCTINTFKKYVSV